MRMLPLLLVAFCAKAAPVDPLSQWSQWRGPLGTGVAPKAAPPTKWDKETNIRSEGLIKGVIQVPADGNPIIMLSDHGTIGGYPKIGVVISADYDKLVQLPPNAKIKFKLVELKEAEKLFKFYKMETDNLLNQIR